MRFNDVRLFVTAGLSAAGYDITQASFPVLSAGPATSVELSKLATDRIIFLTVGGGPGLTSEDVFDRVFITTRTIGRQDDYADAEDLAWKLDTMLLQLNAAAPNARMIGAQRVLYVVRSGGGPVLLEKDQAARYHFTCSYVTEAKSAL